MTKNWYKSYISRADRTNKSVPSYVSPTSKNIKNIMFMVRGV